jgi:thymidine phosphorylase
MVEAQGGHFGGLGDPEHAAYRLSVTAPESGYVSALSARRLGILAANLARTTRGPDPLAGIQLVKQVGDYVEQGEPVMFLVSNDREPATIEALQAFSISPNSVPFSPSVLEVI